MKLGLSKERIIQLATNRDFTVSRYDDKSINIRKKCRRMVKDGILMLVGQYGDKFVYRKRS